MMLNVHGNRKAYWGLGEGGGGGMEVGEEGEVYLSLHCYHQSDSCIKMGSDESHKPQYLKRKESRSGFEPRSLCLLA